MPDAEFRLTPAERALLQADLDHDAFEALLRTLPADSLPFVLRLARDWSHVDSEECLAAFPEITPLGPVGQRTFMDPQFDQLRADDPAIQSAIDVVLATRRAHRRSDAPET